MNNWTQLIPARIRTTLYVGFGILSLTQTAVLSYSAAVGITSPVWAVGAGAVLGVVGGAFGFVAAGNTAVTAPSVEADEVIVAVPDIELEQSDSDGLEIDPDTIPDSDAPIAS